MKLDVVKICAGLIIVLALLMCSSVATETTWRHSGFELWGYDINYTNMNASNVWVLDFEDNGVPSISDGDSGKLYYNDTNATILVSVNGNAYTEIQTADMKNIAGGFPGLDSNAFIPSQQLYGIFEEYSTHYGADSDVLESDASQGTISRDTINHELDMVKTSTAGYIKHQSKATYTLSSKPIVINYIVRNWNDDVFVFNAIYLGLKSDFETHDMRNVSAIMIVADASNYHVHAETGGSSANTETHFPPGNVVDGDIFTIVATSSEIKYYWNGVLGATHTSNIPTTPLHFGVGIIVAGSSGGLGISIDMLDFRRYI